MIHCLFQTEDADIICNDDGCWKGDVSIVLNTDCLIIRKKLHYAQMSTGNQLCLLRFSSAILCKFVYKIFHDLCNVGLRMVFLPRKKELHIILHCATCLVTGLQLNKSHRLLIVPSQWVYGNTSWGILWDSTEVGRLMHFSTICKDWEVATPCPVHISRL